MSVLETVQQAADLPLSRVLNHIGFRINRFLYGHDQDGYNTDGVDVFSRK